MRHLDIGKIKKGFLVDTQELADFLKVSITTIWRLRKRGEIKAIRVGHQIRFDPEECMQMLRDNS